MRNHVSMGNNAVIAVTIAIVAATTVSVTGIPMKSIAKQALRVVRKLTIKTQRGKNVTVVAVVRAVKLERMVVRKKP